MLYFVDRTWSGRHFSSGYQIRFPERLRLCHLLWRMRSFILLLKFKNRKIYERVGSWSPAFPCFIFPCLMMRNSSDRSLWSDHHRSFTTFFYGASRLDWSERELNETTFSKMTLQCCWCFIDCVYSFNSVVVPRFTVDLSVQLSRGEEILLKFIVFASFHSFFFLKLLFFLHTLAAH